MNILVALGIWILCGCITGVMIYHMDENKELRIEVYDSNLFVFFILVFWPLAVYFFMEFLLTALFNPRGGKKKDD